jgi:trigger factor
MTTEPQYEIARRDATEATVRVTITPETFRASLDAVYRRYAKEARIPGFRKGHVPRNVLDSRFGPELFVEEAKEDLQRRHLPEALLKLDLRPVSRPQLEVPTRDPADPFVFTASFSVLPEIDLPEIRGLEVSVPPPPPVSDEDIAGALQEVQNHLATLSPTEGDTVMDGDIVHVREGEKEWDTRASAEDEVTKSLIGASIGDSVAIDAELADGRRLQTTLEVVGLRELLRPEIDDEMAKDANFDSLDALKADIVEKITAARAARHRQLVETALLDRVVEAAGVELPEPFVEDLVSEEVDRFKISFEDSASGGSYEDYLADQGASEEDLITRIRENVTRRLGRELVLRRIAAVEEIRVDDTELEDLARADAEEAEEDPLRFVGRIKADDRWEDYRASKVNERVLGILREAAVVTDAEPESMQGMIIDPTKSREGLVIDPTKEGGGT